jgi:SAM-dependent methyltransferase
MTDVFADKASDYDHKPMPLQIAEKMGPALLTRLALRPDLTVLDFGAGTGLVSSRLAPHVGRILAVDVSPAMLAQLAAKPELAGKVEPICQDLLTTPLGRQVELVVSAMALHHIPDTAGTLRALHDHLLPGGQLALADLDREQGDFHPPETEGVHHHGFDRAELLALLAQAGFVEAVIDTACEVDRDGRPYPIFLATARRPA